MTRETKSLGMPWEKEYGYAQAVKVGDTIYVSGQLSHDDEGNIVGAAPLDDRGRILDHANMEVQMQQTYANAKRLLGLYGATLDNVVEEVLYVTRHGCGICRCRARKEGSLWFGETGRCEHHTCDPALSTACPAH